MDPRAASILELPRLEGSEGQRGSACGALQPGTDWTGIPTVFGERPTVSFDSLAPSGFTRTPSQTMRRLQGMKRL